MKTFIVLIANSEKIRIKANKVETLIGSGTPQTLRFVTRGCNCQHECRCDRDHVVAEFQWPFIHGYFEQDSGA